MSAAEKQEEEKPNIVWDTSEIYSREVEYLQSQEYADGMELEKCLTESEAESMAQGDSDIYENEWDYITDHLAELMREINPDERPWHCDVEGFGWRNLNGYKEFETMNPSKFLGEILPDTDCIFSIYTREGEGGEGRIFYILNFHHDSPMGESYYVRVKPEDDEDDARVKGF